MLSKVLYKIPNNGPIQTIQYEYDDTAYRKIEGYGDGLQIVGPWFEPALKKDDVQKTVDTAIIYKIDYQGYYESLEHLSKGIDSTLITSQELLAKRDIYPSLPIVDVLEDPLEDDYAKFILLEDGDNLIKAGIGGYDPNYLEKVWRIRKDLRGGKATIFFNGPIPKVTTLWLE